MLYRMKTAKVKVTALIPADLMQQVKTLTDQETTTEALILALKEWVAQHRIKEMVGNLQKSPLKFAEGVTAKKLRNLNQQKK